MLHEFPALREREAFERNQKCYQILETSDNHLNFVEVMLKANCAGMRDRSSALNVREALRCEPAEGCDSNPTIRWLLGSIRIEHVMHLNAKCGIPLGRIAEHVRFHQLVRADLILFLNQFADQS